MADEYNSTPNWWDSSRTRFDTSSSSSSSSSGLNTLGSFSWPRSSIDSSSVSDSCSVFQDHKQTHHDSGSELHMMNLGLSSHSVDWNQALL